MGPIRIALGVAAAVAAAAAAYYFWPAAPPPPPPSAPVAAVQPAPAAEPPAEHFPEPVAADAAPARPLPALDESDAAMGEALAGVAGADALARFLVPERLVRNIVVTIDNLPRRTFAMRMSPVKPVGGMMPTMGQDETLAISPDNAARYDPWVAALARVDAVKLVAVYARFYPLFQKAYGELGYPKGHFNTRLVQVIDHLLTAPEPAEPLRLVVRHVLPEYADPALESESAGRKVLFRMGNANAAKVKAKLREIRRELVKAR